MSAPTFPTPGELAYTAYWHSANPLLHGYPWATLAPGEQAHWEAAAQAVLAMQKAEGQKVIHLLRAGVPLCRFSEHAPVLWPEGHRWSAYREETTCGACKSVAEAPHA